MLDAYEPTALFQSAHLRVTESPKNMVSLHLERFVTAQDSTRQADTRHPAKRRRCFL